MGLISSGCGGGGDVLGVGWGEGESVSFGG